MFGSFVNFCMFFTYDQFVCFVVSYLFFYVRYCLWFDLTLVFSTSAIDCLERLICEVTCYVSSRM